MSFEMNIEIDNNRIPQHIAIIMDGNGRWATERGKSRSYGHQAGVESVRAVTTVCKNIGVKYLTLYTFSTENWNRPEEEALLRLPNLPEDPCHVASLPWASLHQSVK